MRPILRLLPQKRGQVAAQNGFGALVVGVQAACIVQRYHAVAQTFQHAFQIMPCGFLFVAVAFVGGFGNGQLFAHVVEELGQPAQFIFLGNRDVLVEIALGDGAGGVGKLHDRADEALGEIQGGGQCQQHGQNGGDAEGD